jgi:chorismate synthase
MQVEILSGVYEGQTTGTPICLLIRNTDQRSKDYGNMLDTFRPGHADYTYWRKYGLRDPRGGGRSSARLTAPTVAAGAVARKWLLQQHGTTFSGWMSQLGEIEIPFEDAAQIPLNPFFAPNAGHRAAAGGLHGRAAPRRRLLRRAHRGARPRRAGGPGRAAVRQAGRRHRLRDDGLNAVKGVEIGDGFGVVAQRGSEHGDELTPGGFASNHAGGVLGGISTGQDLVVPSPSSPPVPSARPRPASTARASPPRCRPSAATTPAWASAPRPSPKPCWRWW